MSGGTQIQGFETRPESARLLSDWHRQMTSPGYGRVRSSGVARTIKIVMEFKAAVD